MEGALKRNDGGLPDGGDSLYNKLRVERVNVKDPEFMSEVPDRMKNKNFPGFPSCSVFVGRPGSGKTNCLIWMLRSKDVWNGFYDKIYAFGPTVKSDQLYETIKIPEDRVNADLKTFLPKLKALLDEQQASMEGDKKAADKILIIFEDMTSFYNKIQNQPEFQRCYTQVRHIKGSSATMVHKYKAFNRTCRTATQHLLIWKVAKTEVKQIFEDFGPYDMSDKEFYDMVRYAHEPTEDNPKPFLYINTMVPPDIQFRKGFNEILKLRGPTNNYEVLKDKNPRKSLKYEDQGERRERSRSPTTGGETRQTRSRSRG